MDAGSHAQPPPENLKDPPPPYRDGDEDIVERPRSGPSLETADVGIHQTDYTPGPTGTPVRPLNLRIIVLPVGDTAGETDVDNDMAEINQDVSIFFRSVSTLLVEPWQVLAGRVLSAIRNPSPPPDFQSFPNIHVNIPSRASGIPNPVR